MKPKRERNPFTAASMMGVLLIAAVLLLTMMRFRSIIREAGVDDNMVPVSYDRHIVMIIDEEDPDFWNDTYESAQKAANERGAYVELKMPDHLRANYNAKDLMKMAIASGADGIILRYSEKAGLDEQIRAASERGIPVVTVMNDAPQTQRISFVGFNPYTIGQLYSEELLKRIPPDKENIRICVLLTDEVMEHNQYQIFNQINTDLVTNELTSGRVSVEAVRLPQDQPFRSDKTISDLFQEDQAAPDFIICFNSMITDLVYQTVIDYNLAGQTQIFGYYTSATTIQAIRSDNVAGTLTADTEAIGKACAEAVLDQLEEGRANVYYGIDMRFVTKEDLPDE